MSADDYLLNILTREAVDNGPTSRVRSVQETLAKDIQSWAGGQLAAITPSGSFAKGTANLSGTDIDLFISISEQCSTPLRDIYETLFSRMHEARYTPKRQNVSINVRVNGFDVDLVPGKRQDPYSEDHSLYRRKANTWTKTNVQKHLSYVIKSRRFNEIRILKLWRDQHHIEFPSFYLEMTVIAALAGQYTSLSQSVFHVFSYIQSNLSRSRVVDPANSDNIVSDDLSETEKQRVCAAAENALSARTWDQIVR